MSSFAERVGADHVFLNAYAGLLSAARPHYSAEFSDPRAFTQDGPDQANSRVVGGRQTNFTRIAALLALPRPSRHAISTVALRAVERPVGRLDQIFQ